MVTNELTDEKLMDGRSDRLLKLLLAVTLFALIATIAVGGWQIEELRHASTHDHTQIVELESLSSPSPIVKSINSANQSISKLEAQLKGDASEINGLEAASGSGEFNSEYLAGQVGGLQGDLDSLQNEVDSLQSIVSCFQSNEVYVWSGDFTC